VCGQRGKKKVEEGRVVEEWSGHRVKMKVEVMPGLPFMALSTSSLAGFFSPRMS
jgi:hypothetical protein